MHKDVPHVLGTLLSTFANPAIAQTKDNNTITAPTAFLADQITGLGSADSLINHMHETTINCMSKLLQRLL